MRPRTAAPAASAAARSKAARFSKWTAPSRLTAVMVVLVVTVAAPAWYFTVHRASKSTVHAPVAMQPVERFSADLSSEAVAALTADPLTHYFGIPLTGNTVAYVVDTDQSMAPYIDNLAILTNSVNRFALSSRRYGIIRAYTDEEYILAEVMEPISDPGGTQPTLGTKLSNGDTNLASALTMTSGWYADQLFLVLAKQVDPQELHVLTRTAEQTGAVVNVIALGEAAAQPELSAVSSATRGRFVAVDDDLYRGIVKRQLDAVSNP